MRVRKQRIVQFLSDAHRKSRELLSNFVFLLVQSRRISIGFGRPFEDHINRIDLILQAQGN